MSVLQFYRSVIEPVMVLLTHIGFMVLMASLPLSKGTSSVTLVILLCFSLFFLMFSGITHQPKLFPNKLMRLFWTFFACFVIGLFYSTHFSTGIEVAYKQNAFLLIPFILFMAYDLVKWYGTLYLTWFVWGTAFAGLVIISLYLLPDEIFEQIGPNLHRFGLNKLKQGIQFEKFGFYTPFIDRLSIGNFISLSVLTCCWFMASRLHSRIFSSFLIALLLFASLVIGGRGGQIGLFAGLAIWAGYFVFHFIQKLPSRFQLASKVTLSTLLFLLIVLTPYIIFRNVPAVWDRYNQMFWELSMLQKGVYQEYDYEHFTTLRRIYSWLGSWDIIVQQPIFGTGTGDYRYELQEVYHAKGWNVPVNAHNQFLQIWAMLGIAGLLVFIAILIAFLKRIFEIGNTPLKVFGVSLIVFYVVIFLFDSAINMQAGNMAFVLILCILSAQPISDKGSTKKQITLSG